MNIKIFRGINADEVYPVSKKSIQGTFEDLDITVCYGMYRSYPQYYRPYRHRTTRQQEKKLSRLVLAEASLNRVEGECRMPGFLLIYPIKKDLYSAEHRREFIESYLPMLHDWYMQESTRCNVGDGQKRMVVYLEGEELRTVEIR